MSKWAAVVLAAGKGTRMESDLPKVLHRVCGTEMIVHVVGAVRSVLEGLVVAVVPKESDGVRACLGDSVEYVEQAEPKGTGHALLQAELALVPNASEILVLYGDTPLLLGSTLAKFQEHHQKSGAAVTLLTSRQVPLRGMGRIVRDGSNRVVDVVEESETNDGQRAIGEVNGGVYAFQAEWLWPALRKLGPSTSGELYLTDLIKLAVSSRRVVESVESEEALETLGVNDRVQLAQAERAMQERILNRLMLAGVTIVDPATAYIDCGVEIGRDTTVHPNTSLKGAGRIGNRCTLGPGSMIYDSTVGDDCKVVASVLEDAHLEAEVDVGPFSHIRYGSVIEQGVHIGNHAEVKSSRLGKGTRMGHFSYVGDAQVGRDVNIGAGVVTCNYDGNTKHQTVIGDYAFIGSDTLLVAPLHIGARARTGAGSVVNKDVPPGRSAIGSPARVRPENK